MKYMKLTLPLLLLVLLLLVPAQAFAADPPVQLYLNGKKLSPEVPPRIVSGGTTLVPVRIVSEELGANVSWNGNERKVKVEQGSISIELTIDDPVVSAGGRKTTLEAAPLLENGSTLVPIRFIAEQLGLKVGWDPLTQSVMLFKVAQDSETADKGGGQAQPGTGEASGKPGAGASDKPVGAGPGGKTDAADADKPAALTRLDAAGDRIVIQTSANVTPSAFVLSNPYRIVVDLPNTELGAFGDPASPGKVGEKTVQHDSVDKVRYALYSSSPSTVRIVLDMKKAATYQLSENKTSREWSVSFNVKTFKVVIDAGHGGKDPGAKSASSRHEKEFTLPLANKVYALLQQEPAIRTVMTRADDTYPSLQERVDLANAENADLFVSIHGNSTKPDIRGTETYYSRPDSAAFAALVHRKIVEAAGLPDRGVRNSGFKVIRDTTMPAVLLEIGYLSNPEDEKQMFSETFQDRVAAAIAAAIKEQLQIPAAAVKETKPADSVSPANGGNVADAKPAAAPAAKAGAEANAAK